jgi:acyl-CoA thioester hydrolase
VSEVFDAEIHPRYRDINLANHVDSVEAIRIVDEARIQFLRFAPLAPPAGPKAGVLGGVPENVSELVAGQRIDYHTEMRFVAFQPFALRLWVSHIGRSSFDVSTELRVAADHPPALVAVTTNVFVDDTTQAPWLMDDGVRASLTRFLADPISLRQRG